MTKEELEAEIKKLNTQIAECEAQIEADEKGKDVDPFEISPYRSRRISLRTQLEQRLAQYRQLNGG